MTVLQSTHSLYCRHCATEKRIFLSTTEEEKESFKKFHSQCNPRKELIQEPFRHQLYDWKERTGQKL